ncbi:MAG: AAA family ATPase [Gammaproteobacteria bacterium]
MLGADHIRAKVDAAQPLPRRNSGANGHDPEDLPWLPPRAITRDELHAAQLTPRCIVAGYLYADVAALIAPGGTGKTTAVLDEHVCIALGLPVWGLECVTPGPSLIVTAEDRRERLVARLREICRARALTEAQTAIVLERVRIDDVTSKPRRLTAVVADTVTPSAFADDIVAGCRMTGFAPIIVTFDPMVSFGVGESRVNDAEQGMIEAARVITAGLDCCTRYVHHSGKGNARDKAVDQYAGRGGSAMADGCRMVAVMQATDAPELAKATGVMLGEDESAFALHRPKVSYAPPQRSPIYVKRSGYAFAVAAMLTAEGREDADAERQRERDRALRGALLDAAEAAWREGVPLTQRGLVDAVEGFKTDAKRDALGRLLAECWLVEVRVPAGWRLTNNARRAYIVRLDANERRRLTESGELPADKMTPPPSVATPAAEGAL